MQLKDLYQTLWQTKIASKSSGSTQNTDGTKYYKTNMDLQETGKSWENKSFHLEMIMVLIFLFTASMSLRMICQNPALKNSLPKSSITMNVNIKASSYFRTAKAILLRAYRTKLKIWLRRRIHILEMQLSSWLQFLTHEVSLRLSLSILYMLKTSTLNYYSLYL